MAALLKFETQPLPLPTAPMPVDPLRLLPDYARVEAERCLAIIRPALIRIQQGVSRRAASQWLASTAETMPSAPTIDRWLRDYLTGGLIELAPKYQPRQRKDQPWMARAVELYGKSPTKPAYATVAKWLRDENILPQPQGPRAVRDMRAQNKAVERYLKSVPSSKAETSPLRLGRHFYNQNVKPHVIRDNTVLPVGFIYEGDGHTCDVYVAHPVTGMPFRPELTTWLDVRSHYVTSWWMSEAESAQTTLFSLSQALVGHNHVPAYVHTDPGSGFKARLISSEVTGFLVRFSIEPILALPGNAKGKGLQEGWYRWFEERCGKRFATFCGHDRSDDFLRHLTAKVKRGEIVLPTLQQYMDAVREYIAQYNATVQEALGCAPADLWAQLQRVELHTPAEAVIRPRIKRTVVRSRVRLDGRKYEAHELGRDHEGRDVIVEYSIHDDGRVAIHDLSGRFVCEARLVGKKAWLPSSRIEEGQQRRLEGQRQRHQRALDEQAARARSPLPIAQPQAGTLQAGHSLVMQAPAPLPMPEPQIDDRTAAILATLPAPEAASARPARRPLSTEEEIAARFERAQRIGQQLAAGADVPADDIEWFNRYRTTAEYRGQMRFLSSFGDSAGNASA
ncbi:MAG TPA: Mu transposase C-terminal domain-containing protein [Nevskiaceae bacterium]|nr:Mu transposase C-terminal domain-containing protein [Nevskiaceae bacterium]